jgi:hypothetical protein
VINGRYLGIEVKGTGGRQADDQKQFELRALAPDSVYILARSLENMIRACGL